MVINMDYKYEQTEQEKKHNDVYGVGRRFRHIINDYVIKNINIPIIMGDNVEKEEWDFVEIVFVGVCPKIIVNKLKKNYIKNNPKINLIFVDRTIQK